MAEEHLENIREIPAVASLIKDIDRFCSENMVIGFHYTRAIPEDILTQGLQPRSGEEIRAQFLSRFAHMFTPVEISAIKAACATYYDERVVPEITGFGSTLLGMPEQRWRRSPIEVLRRRASVLLH